jgi:DNA invertase Pin-like site-specific DNA recombinase
MTTTHANQANDDSRLRNGSAEARLPRDPNLGDANPQDQTYVRPRVLGYTRQSTKWQKTRIADDTRRITAVCVAWEYDLVDVISDAGISGRVPLAERERGARVAALITPRRDTLGRRRLPRVRDREADVIVVSNLDRLSRDTEDGLAILRDLVPFGRCEPVRLISLDDNVDLRTASGRMFAKMKMAFNEYERELIAERATNSAHHRRRAGQAYSSKTPPYGWDHAGDVMVPNPDEQDVIRELRAWRAEDVPPNRMATWLNDRGTPGKLGGRWQAVTVSRILVIADEIEGVTS